ncbi:squalene synthase family protein [Hibiscus syriacus]|uniref:GATA transcription factor n=1 Tax=Hibiscus syriacus TaxID=106335 RepID=A0A6A2ZI62_HIBSY|nr:GATA transcription factor 5-like isoform X1 [Hibiscus syriacus]KAE8690645.1 squalene synthase family protein [Hibiscus syriacus]
MEHCMELRALKSSVRGELTMQKTQHVVFDDFLVMNVINGGAVPNEDFSVDCFLDFNNGEFEEDSVEQKDSVPGSYQERVADDDSNSNSSSFTLDSVFTSELSVPDDEIAGLEWVSHFVDDSLPELPFPCMVFRQQTENSENTRFEAGPGQVFVKTPCFSLSVPSKARSKRAKPAIPTWSVGSLPISESSSSTASSSSICSGLVNDLTEPPTKRQKKRPVAIRGSGLSSGNPFQRRCSHCQVQKTPQWRTGPLGAKTLCNACGVRYKSGRLLPEYRPACSPTFSGDMHSNSHRKVLEMRKKKGTAALGSSELTRMIPSF